jgi:hypothetical protein
LKLTIDPSDFLLNPAKFPSCLSDISASFTPFTTSDSIGFGNKEESPWSPALFFTAYSEIKTTSLGSVSFLI